MEKRKFLKHVENLLNTNRGSKYLDVIYNILICETEEASIIRLNKYKLSKRTYDNYVKSFQKNFPDQIEEIEFLNTLYNKCNEYFGLNKPDKQEDLTVYLKTIKAIIESGYSIEEYCSLYGKYTLSEIEKNAKKIKTKYPDIYVEFNELCKNSSDSFYVYLKWIALDIKHNERFDIFDYFYLTRLNPKDYLSICKNILSKQLYDIVHIRINRFIKITNTIINKESEINGVTYLKDVYVSSLEKEQIFNFLDENHMPYCAYKAALRKYVNNDYRLVEYINKEEKNYAKNN